MLLSLTDLSDEPLQHQITRQIRAKILSGDLQAGVDLHSIRSLAREQRVSVITVQRAYEGLEREGLIHARRRRGFFVSALSEREKRRMAKQRLLERLRPQIAAARAEGLSESEIRKTLARLLRRPRRAVSVT